MCSTVGRPVQKRGVIMTTRASKPTTWEDRFAMPLASDLRAGLLSPLRAVFDAARKAFIEHHQLAEETLWSGRPWCWTLAYAPARLAQRKARPTSAHSPAHSPGQPAIAYLIPHPGCLQVCLPISVMEIAHLGLQGFSPCIRAGVESARCVAGVRWATWETPSKPALAQVLGLLSQVIEFRARPVEAVSR